MTLQDFHISDDKGEIMISKRYHEIIGWGVFTGLVIYFAIMGASFVFGLLALTGNFLYNWIITGSAFPAYGIGILISYLFACQKDDGLESHEKIKKKIYVVSLSPILLYLIMIPGIIGLGLVMASFSITGTSGLILMGILVVIVFILTFIGIPRYYGVSPNLRYLS